MFVMARLQNHQGTGHQSDQCGYIHHKQRGSHAGQHDPQVCWPTSPSDYTLNLHSCLQPTAEGSQCFVCRLQGSASSGAQVRYPHPDYGRLFSAGSIHERHNRSSSRIISLRRAFQSITCTKRPRNISLISMFLWFQDAIKEKKEGGD